MNKILLLVEDNPQDEDLLLHALGRLNIVNRIDVVHDGQQALDYLFRQGEYADRPGPDLPAVVLLDIGLPRINGLDVLTRLRQDPRTALLPVVLLTSSDEERDRLAGYRRGANSFVQKPLDYGEFVESVARLGLYWLLVNKPPGGSGAP